MTVLQKMAIATVLGALTVAAPAHPKAEEATVTFVLVNDLDRMGEADGRSGFARLASVVKAERARGGHVIFAHAGDSISPSLMSGIDHGAHIIELLNAVGPDVYVLGNHEFDFGPDVLRERLAEAKFSILAGNVREADGNPLAHTTDRRTFKLGGFTIEVIGVTSEDSYEKSSPGDLKIGDARARAGELVAAAREEGADLAVVLAHIDVEDDFTLARSGAADMILSGDDHHLLTYFDGRTVLVESSSQANYVTAIDVRFVRTGEGADAEVEWHPEFRIIDTATVEPDAEVAAIVEGFESELSSELDVALGKTATELDSGRAVVRGGEAAIGNLIADAMRAATGADVALMNGGGIRGDRTYAAGTALTRRDILSELPFGNKTVLLEVTGAQITEALENGVSQLENGAGRFPQSSGMSFTVDPAAAPGNRISDVKIGGAALDPAATYKLATNDFMARGGDGYTVLAESTPLIDERAGKLLANDVMVYIRESGEVAPSVEGRIATR